MSTAESYHVGDHVLVQACAMHEAQTGTIMAVWYGTEGTRGPVLTEYWVRFSNGEMCLHPHNQVEVKSYVSFGQEAATVVGKA